MGPSQGPWGWLEVAWATSPTGGPPGFGEVPLLLGWHLGPLSRGAGLAPVERDGTAKPSKPVAQLQPCNSRASNY